MTIKMVKGKVEGKKEVQKRKGTEEIVKEREEGGKQRRWRREKSVFRSVSVRAAGGATVHLIRCHYQTCEHTHTHTHTHTQIYADSLGLSCRSLSVMEMLLIFT